MAIAAPALAAREPDAGRNAPTPSRPTLQLVHGTGPVAALPVRRQPRAVYMRRRIAVLALLVLAGMATLAPLRSEAAPSVEPEPAVVVVGSGDTLWDLAWPYVPAGEDLRNYVLEVAAENGIAPGALRPGMVVRFPLR